MDGKASGTKGNRELVLQIFGQWRLLSDSLVSRKGWMTFGYYLGDSNLALGSTLFKSTWWWTPSWVILSRCVCGRGIAGCVRLFVLTLGSNIRKQICFTNGSAMEKMKSNSNFRKNRGHEWRIRAVSCSPQFSSEGDWIRVLSWGSGWSVERNRPHAAC